ncbi:hypothetical protein V8E54_012986 [Elaphomyces granulatus]
MASKSEHITLVSKDDASFTVERDIAECSILLRNLLNDDDVDPDKPIPIPGVDQFTLKRVLEWCTHHRSDPRPDADADISEWFTLKREDTTTDISEWDQKFIDESNGPALFPLVLAANLLGIKPLFDLAFNTVDSMIEGNTIEGKSADEICKTYGILRVDMTSLEGIKGAFDEIYKAYGIKMDEFTPEQEDLVNELVDSLGKIDETYKDFTSGEKDLLVNKWADLLGKIIKGTGGTCIDSTPEELEEESAAERISGLTLE